MGSQYFTLIYAFLSVLQINVSESLHIFCTSERAGAVCCELFVCSLSLSLAVFCIDQVGLEALCFGPTDEWLIVEEHMFEAHIFATVSEYMSSEYFAKAQ